VKKNPNGFFEDTDLLMEDATRRLYRIAVGLYLPIDASMEDGIRTYSQEFATKDLYHHPHDPSEPHER